MWGVILTAPRLSENVPEILQPREVDETVLPGPEVLLQKPFSKRVKNRIRSSDTNVRSVRWWCGASAHSTGDLTDFAGTFVVHFCVRGLRSPSAHRGSGRCCKCFLKCNIFRPLLLAHTDEASFTLLLDLLGQRDEALEQRLYLYSIHDALRCPQLEPSYLDSFVML